MDVSSSEDEVFVGVATAVEKKVRVERQRRQTEEFTPNFRQRLRGAPKSTVVEAKKQTSSMPKLRLDFDDSQASPSETVDSPPVIPPILTNAMMAKRPKTFFANPWLSDENVISNSGKGKSELKRCAEELGKRVSIRLDKPGRTHRKRANPTTFDLTEKLDQCRQLLQRQEDELHYSSEDLSLENVDDCLHLLTSVNTAENAAFGAVVPTVTPQLTPANGKVRFRPSDDLLSFDSDPRKTPRIATNLHKSILKANHAARVAQENAVCSNSDNVRVLSSSSTDSSSSTTSLASPTRLHNFVARAVSNSAGSTEAEPSSSKSTVPMATPSQFPNLISRIISRRH